MRGRGCIETLSSHLEARYGLRKAHLSELDLGVFRVDRSEGSSWVARLSPTARPLVEVEGDAEILRLLDRHGFPAERCAHPDPVSVHEEKGVIVTEYVHGARADRSTRIFRTLGDLLGRLNTMPDTGAGTRAGGAWHHVAPRGGPRDEIDAALVLLAEAERRLPASERSLYELLCRELRQCEDCQGLPCALIHPDLVPANLIALPGGEAVVVDWAGAGRGPRISSLAFLLWAAAGAGLGRVDAVVDGYRAHVQLEPDELERIGGAMVLRPLILDCWAFAAGRKGLAEVLAGVPATRELARAVAGRARLAFEEPRARYAAREASVSRAPRLEAEEIGLAVAALRAEETARPDRLFADPLAGAFVAASGWSPRPDEVGEARLQALRAWVVSRTLFLDDLLVSAWREGCRQVVVLGARFDTRAFRLPWPAGARCFELDTGEALARKAEVLAAQAGSAACERVPVGCDLREDWPRALLAAGLRSERPSVWIAEGVLVSLTAAEVERVLVGLTGCSTPGSRLGLTLSGGNPPPGEGDPQGSPALRRRRSGAPADPLAWLAGHGWEAQVTRVRDVLRAHGRPLPGRTERPELADEAPGSPAQARPRALLVSAVRPGKRRDGRPTGGRRSNGVGEAGGAAPADAVAVRPALATLLSQVLVAFTIEFDNEFERRMPHRTTCGSASGSGDRPWLVSLVMWSNFMRFVDDGGLSVGELQARAGLSKAAIESQLTRMEKWWGYIVVEPDAADSRSRPPRSELVVRPTPAGRRAREVWQALLGEIETRWRLRFGENAVAGLRGSLEAVVGQLDVALPHYLPLGGIEAIAHPGARVAAGHGEGLGTLDLSGLLSQALLAFTIDFERESEISLALSANALRVLGESGLPLRDLPRLTGVSREAIAVSVRILERREYIVVEPDPARGRSKSVRLTPKGRSAREASHRLLAVVEERWEERSGTETIARLRAALQGLFDQRDGGEPRLSQGLEPHPTGWRARKPFLAQTTAVLRDPRSGLPHYPVVSHRGGFPDGS